MNSIVARNLCRTYRDGELCVEVFKNINLNVAPGEMLAIIGASGAGKSTLLQLLGGLDKATDGEVLIHGHNVNTMSEKAKGQLRNKYLGFIYQFHHLLPEFNALENVAMPLLIRGDSIKKSREQAAAQLERVGLAQRVQHRIGELSGGERQRVAIARALVTNPACVLADEPTGNLDPHTADQVFETMLRLNRELGTSFVVVTHNRDLARQLDRTLELQDGRLVDIQ